MTDQYDIYEDEWDDREDDYPCDHEDHDVDLLEGRARCYRCGESWFLSEADYTHYADMQAHWDAWCAEQERPWTRFKAWLSGWRYWRPWPRKPADLDDELPF